MTASKTTTGTTRPAAIAVLLLIPPLETGWLVGLDGIITVPLKDYFFYKRLKYRACSIRILTSPEPPVLLSSSSAMAKYGEDVKTDGFDPTNF